MGLIFVSSGKSCRYKENYGNKVNIFYLEIMSSSQMCFLGFGKTYFKNSKRGASCLLCQIIEKLNCWWTFGGDANVIVIIIILIILQISADSILYGVVCFWPYWVSKMSFRIWWILVMLSHPSPPSHVRI